MIVNVSCRLYIYNILDRETLDTFINSYNDYLVAHTVLCLILKEGMKCFI